MDRAKVGIIVQARMSSWRLPGKVLAPLAGRPLLGRLLDALRQAKEPDLLLVATSADASDDPVAAFCQSEGAPCFRGPLDDVAARFLAAAEAYGLDAFVRICGDSPLLDPRLVDEAVALFRAADADLVTNVLRRTFPKGQSVEVVRTQSLRRAVAAMTDAQDREHVTRHFYACPERYRIRAFESGGDFGGTNLCVDTPEDLARVERLFSLLETPAWSCGWRQILALEDGRR